MDDSQITCPVPLYDLFSVSILNFSLHAIIHFACWRWQRDLQQNTSGFPGSTFILEMEQLLPPSGLQDFGFHNRQQRRACSHPMLLIVKNHKVFIGPSVCLPQERHYFSLIPLLKILECSLVPDTLLTSQNVIVKLRLLDELESPLKTV